MPSLIDMQQYMIYFLQNLQGCIVAGMYKCYTSYPVIVMQVTAVLNYSGLQSDS